MKFLTKIKRYYREAYQMGHYPSLAHLMFSKKKVLAYYGFLGDNNFGDELVYHSSRELFKPYILIPIKRRMPLGLSFYSRFFRSRFSGVVIGGGTLIGPLWDRDFFLGLAKSLKPVFVHGTGVHKQIECSREWKDILGGKVFGGVRGPLSINHLAMVSDRAKIAGDAAFAVFNVGQWSGKAGNSRKVLINLGTHSRFDGQEASRKELERFIQSLIRKGFQLQFFPFHEKDVEMGLQLKNRCPEVELLPLPQHFMEAVEVFQQATFAVGERLHFTVMAILSKTPFVSINYSEKHEDLLSSICLSQAGLRPLEVLFESLEQAFENREQFDWPGIAKQLELLKKLQIEEQNSFVSSIECGLKPETSK